MAFDFDKIFKDALGAGVAAAKPGGKAAEDWVRESAKANEGTLRAWLASRNITILGAPTYAYYNDPFTPGPLRRNEVMFDVNGP